tara:strand:+ start:47 stop:424 length:378 start_codon:yes stop_codon:yes gene_type:complete
MAKLIFQIINIIFIILYVYPGSILGFIINKDFSKQPQITSDFMLISSNHVYAFLVLSLTGILSYFNVQKVIIFYLFFISIILELFHLLIPNRSFQFSDLFGNIIGVLISLLILIIINFWRKNEFI